MSDRTTTTIAAVALVACLAGAAAIAGAVQKQREELELVVKMEGIRGMPPHVAIVTAALGTFRGLAVDVLWARADHLQTEGDFYEAQTLAQWITMLQPRFQKVWGFQAWNLSWNIAAATQVPAERWGWVSRGIDLLRSRGIPLNPKASSLYFDLAPPPRRWPASVESSMPRGRSTNSQPRRPRCNAHSTPFGRRGSNPTKGSYGCSAES
jgi:hypothetical protein